MSAPQLTVNITKIKILFAFLKKNLKTGKLRNYYQDRAYRHKIIRSQESGSQLRLP
jgi:hypothetical protein